MITNEQLTTLIELDENFDFGLRTYSGRGMYGEYCLAVNSLTFLEELHNKLFNCVTKDVKYNEDEPCNPIHLLVQVDNIVQEKSKFFTMFLNPNSDSLGKGNIYYYPKIKLTKEQLEKLENL